MSEVAEAVAVAVAEAEAEAKVAAVAAKAAGQPPWVVLNRVAINCMTLRRSISGTCLDFLFKRPPSASHWRVFSNTSLSEVCFTAFDASSAYFLLFATETLLHGDRVSYQRAYYVCDGTNGAASRLSPTQCDLDPARVGVIGGPAGKVIVAELRCHEDRATIYYTGIDADGWKEKEVFYPTEDIGDGEHQHKWHGNGVISHGNFLWFLDLSVGMLRYDPFADESVLEFVPLPHDIGSKLGTGAETQVELTVVTDTSRLLIQVSRGKLRLVQLEGTAGRVVIRSWSLIKLESGRMGWKHGYELPLLQMWSNQVACRDVAVRFRERLPDLAFVSPPNQYLIYLTLDQNLFGVNLISGEMEELHELDSLNCEGGRRDNILVMSFFQKPWTILTKSIMLETLPTEDKGIALQKRGNPPQHTTTLSFDANLKLCETKYCYVAAADPTCGKLIICTIYQRKKKKKQAVGTIVAYYVVDDIGSPSLRRLPVLNNTVDHQQCNAGIMLRDQTTYAILVEHCKTAGHAVFRLWMSTSSEDLWETTPIRYNFPSRRDKWNSDEVIGHENKFFLINLSEGLLVYDLFTNKETLSYISLPLGCDRAENMALGSGVNKKRCINVSRNKIRLVELAGPDESPVAKMWTLLVDPNEGISWVHDYTLSFNNPGLWKKPLCVGLIHPWRCDTLYIVQNNTVLTVDITGRVSEKTELLPAALHVGDQSSLIQWTEVPLKVLTLFPRAA